MFFQLNRAISSWIHSFRENAIAAVSDEFKLRKLEKIEDRKLFVRAILGTAEEQVGAERPFLWMSTDDEDWKGSGPLPDRKKKNIFSFLILIHYNH